MKIITSNLHNHPKQNKLKRFDNSINKSFSQNKPSFKSAAPVVSLISQTGKDRQLADVFSQHYGKLADRLGEKLGKLATSNSKLLQRSSRFSLKEGALSIKDKTLPRALLENIIFPVFQLPLYAGSWVLNKVRSIPVNPNAKSMIGKGLSAVKKKANDLYGKALFRIPRKLNELDAKTNALDGIMKVTQKAINNAADKLGSKPDVVLDELLHGKNEQASKLVKEHLYKIGNKFFDKNTGNYNTAFERPLNRIVTGLIPVMFLANDAYNLSVLCGDKKEDSVKEANIRKRQELTRVFTTAYIQLLMFGAFTKQVNTISWFTPLATATTVLFSEIFSRKRMKKPIFFLTKEQAQERNREAANQNTDKSGKTSNNTPVQKAENIKPLDPKEERTKNKLSSINFDILKDTNNIFTTFKAGKNDSNVKGDNSKEQTSAKKEEPKKALINFKTFKKGVAILLAAGFTLSFLKNSSFTKDTKLVKGIKSIGEYFKKNVYNKLALKDFEITPKRFEEVTSSIKNVADDIALKNPGQGDKFGLRAIAEGHEFIRREYGRDVIKQNGTKVIKMFQYKLPKDKLQPFVEETMGKIGPQLGELSAEQTKIAQEALKTAVGKECTNIAEKKFSGVAKTALDIMKKKGISVAEDKVNGISESITDVLSNSVTEKAVQMETKLKPFVDMVTQPFKFIFSVAKFPFKVATLLVNLATSSVRKKAENAALGGPELTKAQKAINRVVTEIYGKKEPKADKICQTVFANAMEQLDKKTLPYRTAVDVLNKAKESGVTGNELEKLKKAADDAQHKLSRYINSAVEKSFNNVTQSSNKNTDLALMSKLASSAVTSAFLVADNYNMVMLKSNGEDKEGAKEKANERIIQRLSGLFYQAMLINWFNGTFRSTYTSSLKGMACVSGPNTIASEILTRKSIGMPITRKTLDELNAIDEKNEKRTGFLGGYFKFMRLLTGKKPLKDRLPKNKQIADKANSKPLEMTNAKASNWLEKYSK